MTKLLLELTLIFIGMKIFLITRGFLSNVGHFQDTIRLESQYELRGC